MIPEQTAPKVIPDTILADMVRQCAGDQKQILVKAALYIRENEKEIQAARWKAEIGLSMNLGGRSSVKEDSRQALADLNKVLNSAIKLKEWLSEISDLAETPAPITSGLTMQLQKYMFSVDDWEANQKRREYYGCDETDEKLNKWYDFLDLLDHHILVFEGIQTELNANKKKGRPNTISGLTGFICAIAKLYAVATDNKFTVCEYGDKAYFTEGMRFAQSAMAIIHIPFGECHESYKEFLNSARYTDENFQNACAYAARKSRELGKNKHKSA